MLMVFRALGFRVLGVQRLGSIRVYEFKACPYIGTLGPKYIIVGYMDP